MKHASQIISVVTICALAVFSAPDAHSAEATHVAPKAHNTPLKTSKPTAKTMAKVAPRMATNSRSRRTVRTNHAPSGFVGASAAAIAAVGSEAQVVDARFSPAAACGSMLMPAAALKQVSRGFTSYHSGIDLMAPYGSPIRAAVAGRVVFAGWYFGYGNMVDIQSDNGVVTRYGHMSAFAPETKPGHAYAVGETIGQIGTSGMAHGPHVHFEVRMNGRAIDPAPFLALGHCPAGSPSPAIEEARAPETPRGTVAAAESRPGGMFQ